MELKVCFLGAVRRRTFICCRNIQISTSSAVRDRNRSATIQTMNLTRSLIPQEHRPILDQLPVRLSLRQGHRANRRNHSSVLTSPAQNRRRLLYHAAQSAESASACCKTFCTAPS